MTRVLHLAASLLAGAGTATLFLLLTYLTLHWWLGVMILLWIILVTILVRFLNQAASYQTRTTELVAVTMVSGFGLFSVVEEPGARWALLLLVSGLVALLGVLSVPEMDGALEYKRVRRLLMIVWTWNVFALTATAYAVALFFPEVPWWLSNLGGGVIAGGIAWAVWRMYFDASLAVQGLWGAIFALAWAEIMWVMQALPLGFFVSGWLTAWIWYVAQLLVRWHFSPSGIVWRQQSWFLLWNAIALITGLLWFVRWV